MKLKFTLLGQLGQLAGRESLKRTCADNDVDDKNGCRRTSRLHAAPKQDQCARVANR